jgi:hypothetical protein
MPIVSRPIFCVSTRTHRSIDKSWHRTIDGRQPCSGCRPRQRQLKSTQTSRWFEPPTTRCRPRAVRSRCAGCLVPGRRQDRRYLSPDRRAGLVRTSLRLRPSGPLTCWLGVIDRVEAEEEFHRTVGRVAIDRVAVEVADDDKVAGGDQAPRKPRVVDDPRRGGRAGCARARVLVARAGGPRRPRRRVAGWRLRPWSGVRRRWFGAGLAVLGSRDFGALWKSVSVIPSQGSLAGSPPGNLRPTCRHPNRMDIPRSAGHVVVGVGSAGTTRTGRVERRTS